MSDYETKTYKMGGVQLNGWFTIEELRGIIDQMERMNQINRVKLDRAVKELKKDLWRKS